jgi:phage gp29-like protein
MFPVEETEDITAYSQSLPPLVALGFKIPRQWAQERLGIPEPEADDTDLLVAAKPPAPAPPSPTDPAAAPPKPATAATTAQPTDPQDPPARMVDQLDTAVSPAIDGWLAQIRELAGRVDSLDALREGILQLASDMSLDQYAEAIAQGLAAAALAGRYEILQEAGTP